MQINTISDDSRADSVRKRVPEADLSYSGHLRQTQTAE